ncbi:MAG TPA: hypothetical protein VGF06_00660 [Terriglobales bacterium]|jgi:hypothetical protein
MPKYFLRWALITLLAAQALPQSADEIHSTTRFGVLTLDSDDYVQFKGHRLSPAMQKNNSIELSDAYSVGTSDVVLVTIIGGTACPYLYHFVTVTKHGATATRAFGTCNQADDVERVSTSIVVKMHGFLGPFEPEPSRKRAFKEQHTFFFKNGVLTKDGKPLK